MRLIYVTDPICSWRYGFGPQLADPHKRPADTLGASVPATVITGGLRLGQHKPMAADKHDEILHRWYAMAERSGMPLDQSPTVTVRRDGFIYGTEPARHVVVMARGHWTEDDGRVLTFFHAIQHAFYGEGHDTTQAGVLRDVVPANGVEAEHFGVVPDTDAPCDETREDFCPSRCWSITDLPSLLAEQGNALYQIGRGYVPSVVLYAQAVEVLQ